MPSQPVGLDETARTTFGGARSWSAVARSIRAAAAQPIWPDAWAAMWGVLLARPDVLAGGTWTRAAGVGALLWLLAWARDLEVAARRPHDEAARRTHEAAIPGGRAALVAGTLAVAAVLGAGPFALAGAWLALGLGPTATGGAATWTWHVRLWLVAVIAWLAFGGVSAADAVGVARFAPFSSTPWLAARGAEIAVLAGCALAVPSPAAAQGGGSSWIRRRGAAFVVLGAGLTAAERPNGLWIVALCAAALWPQRTPAPARTSGAADRAWLPVVLAAACVVDALLG